jgi:hypothetical protein
MMVKLFIISFQNAENSFGEKSSISTILCSKRISQVRFHKGCGIKCSINNLTLPQCQHVNFLQN